MRIEIRHGADGRYDVHEVIAGGPPQLLAKSVPIDKARQIGAAAPRRVAGS